MCLSFTADAAETRKKKSTKPCVAKLFNAHPVLRRSPAGMLVLAFLPPRRSTDPNTDKFLLEYVLRQTKKSFDGTYTYAYYTCTYIYMHGRHYITMCTTEAKPVYCAYRKRNIQLTMDVSLLIEDYAGKRHT